MSNDPSLGVTPPRPNSEPKLSEPKSPNSWGPFAWKIIHNLALFSKSIEEVSYYIKHLLIIVKSIECEKCKIDALTYIQEINPPLKYYIDAKKYYKSNIDNIGKCMFVWSCNFHNYVNFKINKPTYNWRKAHTIHLDSFYNQNNVTNGKCIDCPDQNDNKIKNDGIMSSNTSIHIEYI